MIVRATLVEAGDEFEPFAPYEDPAQKTYHPVQASLAEDEDFPGKWKRFRQAKDRATYEALGEVSPPGWEGTIKRMKKHPEISNPWALGWWMKNQGYAPRKSAEAQAFQLLKGFVQTMTRDLRRLEAAPAGPLSPLLRKGVKKPGAFIKDAQGHGTSEPDLPLRSFRSDVRRKVKLKKLMGPKDESPRDEKKFAQAEVA